jgi:tetratricopeptide (TPR) repeat protein
VSFWSSLRDFFRDPPRGPPDVASFPDSKLEKLWNERHQLTDVAREAVRAEVLKRGLQLRGLKPVEPAGSRTVKVLASGGVVDVRPGVGVLLQTTPGRFALMVLPRWNPAPLELPGDLPLDALIICNHEPHGWLDGSSWVAAAKLDPENVYATAAGAIDRSPGAQGGEATLFPFELELGSLTLRRLAALPNVLRATWHGAAATAAIGPMLPHSLVEAQPGSSAYVGSLPEPDGQRLWAMLLSAAHASSMMAASGLGGGQGPLVLIAGDAVGAPLRWHTHLHAGFGITMTGVECPVLPSAVELLGDVSSGRWESIASTTATDLALEEVFEHLLTEAQLDQAWKLIAAVLPGRETNGTVQRLRGTLLALDGQHDEALAALALAQGDPFSAVIASAVYASRRDWLAAEREARRAVELLPREPHALGALSRCLWLSGRVEEARQVVDDAPAFSLTGTQAADLYAVIERDFPGEAPHAPAMPHLAARALDTARRARDPAQGQRYLRRALELDPECAAAAAALSSPET